MTSSLAASRSTRRTVLRGLAAGAVGAVGVAVAPAAAPVEATRPHGPLSRGVRRPNVVVISIDDLGWRELGCYGNTFNETPRIDALAARGTRFTQAYAAAPLCSPTRAALVTGRYPARVGITDFLRSETAVSDKRLSTDVPTVPDVLGPLGYTTGLVGKWHLTEAYATPPSLRPGGPVDHGFEDVRLSEERYIGGGDYFHPYGFMPSVAALQPGEHLTDRLAREAESFVADHAGGPFWLHLSNYAVHTTLDPRPDLLAQYAAKPGADDPAHSPALAAMLASVDAQVGAVVDALHEHGIADRTLVVVTSDNGGANREATAPLRGGKGELYEGGIRVPLVIAWAGGRGQAGGVSDVPVSTVDLLPTALDLAGGRRGGPHRFDGISLAPLLRTAGGPARGVRRPDDALFWVYPHHIGRTHPHAAVRQGRLKLVQQLRDGSVELFDLTSDPAETTDLAPTRPTDAARLRRLLEDHLREVDVVAPAPTPAAFPVAEAPISYATADLLAVPPGSAAGTTTVDGGALRVGSEARLVHVLARTDVVPSDGPVAAVLETRGFSPTGQATAFVGLAGDADHYLLLRYRHDLRRVGWDLRVGGTLLDGGAEPLTSLDGSVDLSDPGSRLGFVLRDSVMTAYADQARGAGWEFLFAVDTGGAFDLSDPALRATTRYAASARVQRGWVELGALTAARAS